MSWSEEMDAEILKFYQPKALRLREYRATLKERAAAGDVEAIERLERDRAYHRRYYALNHDRLTEYQREYGRRKRAAKSAE
jgi:hypothetical protein